MPLELNLFIFLASKGDRVPLSLIIPRKYSFHDWDLNIEISLALMMLRIATWLSMCVIVKPVGLSGVVNFGIEWVKIHSRLADYTFSFLPCLSYRCCKRERKRKKGFTKWILFSESYYMSVIWWLRSVDRSKIIIIWNTMHKKCTNVFSGHVLLHFSFDLLF